ncbi:F-box only protein 39-like [Saccostrea echinata]|uniref:F-box only protein 39-like n=1 Tax=Saccostrea echinata TaxID=191078 RepID=UPI002A7F0EB7|nr:F-box only protein 39-like [Saccostrea echinata]
MGLSDWNVLPDLVLLEVFSQLGDEDRLTTALVCKNWHRIFQSPQLWRARRVIFSAENPFTVATKSLGFLKSFGKNLKDLTVGFSSPNFRNAKQISKASELFFRKASCISDLRIREFTLQNANMEVHWHFILSRNRIISALCKFLRSLQEVSLINFIAAKMSLTDGCRVLESLGRGKASKTLKTAFIEDMFQAHVSPNRHERYTSAITKFKSISWMYTNYNTINSAILSNISKHMGKQFHKLTLTIDSDVSSNIIQNKHWNDFSSNCQNVEVVLYIYASAFKQDVPSILVSGIPLKEIDIVSWPSTESARRALESQISRTLGHISTTFCHRLECLTLHLDRNPPIDSDLLLVLKRCKQLKELNLYCKIRVETVQAMCQMQQQRMIDLHAITLAIHGLSEIEWRTLTEVRGDLIEAVSRRKSRLLCIGNSEN